MACRFPVSVRINDGSTDRHVTASATNLRWKSTAPGGFHSASMTLTIDPSTFTDLGPADRIYIYGPNGATLWEGFLDNPARTAGDEGVGLDISAMGTVVLASDRRQALPYLTRDLGNWTQNRASSSAVSASASVSDDPSATSGGAVDEGLLVQLNPGQPVVTGSVAQIGWSGLVDAGMELGVVGCMIKSGKVDANYRTDIVYSSGPGTAALITIGTNINTTPTNVVRYVGLASSFPAGQNRIAVQLRRSGAATNVADDTTWSLFYSVAIVARRMDAAGNLLDATALQAQGGAVSVRADHIVADLVGRMLTVRDPNNVTIDAASYAIDQLSYTEPVSMADVLDDLSLYEPDFYWGLGASSSAGYAFWYRAWPTMVRYEVSTRDGYDAPGSDVDLCNRIAVKWTDVKGVDRTTIVTATSAQYPALKALEDVGRVRDAEPITLPEGRGSAANAQRAGEQALAARANPPKAATATVRRPIADLLRGGFAMPYELEPGYLVRVRETGDVLRCTEVEVDDEAGVATLTLGEPVLSEEQRLARLERTTRRK